MEEHNKRVQDIAQIVRGFYERKQKYRIFHGSTNSTRNQVFRDKQNVVDTSSLKHVLNVDAKKRIALVEANVPMDRLVEATLAHNCVPPVVMDFPGITVGGGYAGTACGSSSFKHGYFNRTMNRVEVVLPNGEIVWCSETEQPDLFHGAAAALGTLGVVTLVELRLEAATKYVEVTYWPVSSFQEAVDKIQNFTESAEVDKYDYLDGILFSKDSGAIITGRRTNDRISDMPVARFSAPTDPWFFWHVQKRIAKSKNPVTELIPLPEYLFRYDRGGFWVAYNMFKNTPWLPFNTFTRRLLDNFIHTRMCYAVSEAAPFMMQTVQDMVVPLSSAPAFLDWVKEEVQIWPLWLCPIRREPGPSLHPQVRETAVNDTMLNIGIWGEPKEYSLEYHIANNQAIEAKLHEFGGMKWMYGVNYQNEQDFWRDLDRKWYEELREKYHAFWMPSIFDKATTDPKDVERFVQEKENMPLREAWPLILPGAMVTSFWRAWKSKEWKWKKESTWPDWVPREKTKP